MQVNGSFGKDSASCNNVEIANLCRRNDSMSLWSV